MPIQIDRLRYEDVSLSKKAAVDAGMYCRLDTALTHPYITTQRGKIRRAGWSILVWVDLMIFVFPLNVNTLFDNVVVMNSVAIVFMSEHVFAMDASLSRSSTMLLLHIIPPE